MSPPAEAYEAPKESCMATVAATPKRFITGLTFLPGDFGSLTQLFFDNLSTLLGVLYAIISMETFGVSRSLIDSVIYGRIVPAIGITIVLGNVYYVNMAVRMTRKMGRQYTAQPYGLNTPAAFAFVYNIMYPVYFAQLGSGRTPDEAFIDCYNVALGGNFIAGLILGFLGVFGPQILTVVPPGALLVPISGIGFAFLGLQQVTPCIAAPMVGFLSIMMMFVGWYGFVKIGWGSFRIPEALQVIVIGVVLGWATGLNEKQDVTESIKLVKWWGPYWAAKDLFANFDQIGDYLGIVIPIGIASAATTLMCLVSAKAAGEPYPVRETMFTDACGTLIVSLFGSPFGTVVYIGHPAHKRSGAKTGYSFMNGWVFFLLSWFGLFALASAIVNSATIGPIVLFVGLMICEECLNFIPPRHYAVFIFGVFPSIYDWSVNQSGRSPLISIDGLYNTNVPDLTDPWWGVLAFKNGALLIALIWSAMIVQTIDRKWWQASIWGLFGAFFSVFGIIHMPEAGFKNFTDPTNTQCTGSIDEEGVTTVTCWQNAKQWQFFAAYLMMFAIFMIVEAWRRFGKDSTLLPPIVDAAYSDAFKNWWQVEPVDLGSVDVMLMGSRGPVADPELRRKSQEGNLGFKASYASSVMGKGGDNGMSHFTPASIA